MSFGQTLLQPAQNKNCYDVLKEMMNSNEKQQ